MKKVWFILAFAFLAGANSLVSAITENKIISRGKPVFTSNGNAAYLVDNKFKASEFTVKANAWIAISVDQGPTKVFLNWNNPCYAWSNELQAANCPNGISFPIDYNIITVSF